MRKFNRHQPRILRFRLFLVVAGILLLAAAFVPRTHAAVLAYWNFDDSQPPVGMVDMMSDAPTVFGSSLTLVPFGPTAYTFPDMRTDSPGLDPGSITGPSVFGMGLSKSGLHSPTEFRFAMPAGVIFTGMTFQFTINRAGNAFSLASLEFGIAGINGPMTVIPGSLTVIPDGATIIVSAAVPVAANNQPNLAFGIILTGGQSNGNNLQNVVDNILINGTIVPEPATIAGGLLGVLGLCWFQRRRLISALRLRRA